MTERHWSNEEMSTAVERALSKRPCSEQVIRSALGAEFLNKFPGLTAMLCSKSVDADRIRRMLKLTEKIEKGSIAEYDASAEIGTELFEEYHEQAGTSARKN